MTKKIDLPSSSPLMQEDFLFGVATSSFQIEGEVDKRLPCIWDTFCGQENTIVDGSNGKSACEHVQRWREDFDLLKQLQVDAYRFSISWPRVIKSNGTLNEAGIEFYSQQLDALQAMGIQAWVTLYHWDLPQHLEEQGGWLNRETAYEYARYVEIVAKRLAGKVAGWSTFNEPFCSAYLGYEVGVHAPGKTGRKNGRQAAHHILLAHGLGMKILREVDPGAKHGIVLNFTPCYASSESAQDQRAANLAHQYINLWYIEPLMNGKYPEVMNHLLVDDQPVIEVGDMEIIKQPLDYLGVNYYTRLTYSASASAAELYTEHQHLEPKTSIGWEIFPQGLYDILIDLHERYHLPPIYITENGAALNDVLADGQVNDQDRIDYYNNHLNMLSDAVEAGVDVKGYFAWSLMDNFEWAEGYTQRFGLIYVDFSTQQRILKESAKAYTRFLSKRKSLNRDKSV